MTTQDSLWTTKLHARLHDPAEKALVLLRDPEGHEGGTCRALARLMGWETSTTSTRIDADNAQVLHCTVFKDGLSRETYQMVKRADWWAAAADRPQFPMQELNVTNRRGEEVVMKVAPGSQAMSRTLLNG
jgi:CRISPR-associated protein Cmr2